LTKDIKTKESASFLPVDGLVQIPIHLAEQDLEPPLGLRGRELVKLLRLLAGAEDGLVVEPVVVVRPAGTVPRIPRTECPVLFSLSALAATPHKDLVRYGIFYLYFLNFLDPDP
jgi:hypothetical protein